MNGFSICVLLLGVMLLISVPRRLVCLPLLGGACYVTLGQGVQIGPFNFPLIRMLIGIGVVRAIVRNERIEGGLNRLDKCLIIWGAWALLASLLHREPLTMLVRHLGMVYNAWGIYFLVRTACRTPEDVVNFVKITAWVLVPVALEMLYEVCLGGNLFGYLNDGDSSVTLRGDRVRASGPFAHPILAGTVGGVCLPMMVGIWRQERRSAAIGCVACVFMILFSASSGPLLAVLSGILAVAFWRYRHLTRSLRRAAVGLYVLLEIVMKAPPYFLLARVDLTGNSTGWHRAELIRSAFAHLDEWWFVGVDYTRHWMTTGVYWSEDHVDITNQYIGYGVAGGLPLMLLFVAMLVIGFSYVGRSVKTLSAYHVRFMTWCLGGCLFAHTVSGISVFYADQSFLFLFAALAVISSVYAYSVGQGAEQYSLTGGMADLPVDSCALIEGFWSNKP